MNKDSPTVKRLMKEAKEMITNHPTGVLASPLENNLFEWHFTIAGVEKTVFEGGRYHGKMIFPSEYPFKPPNLMLLNKSGRFEVGKKVCLNFSGFHPEQWQPSWTIRSMLIALRAFMETHAGGAIGAIEVNNSQRRRLAQQSIRYICPVCHAKMADLFNANKGDNDDDDDDDDSLDLSDSESDPNHTQPTSKNESQRQANDVDARQSIQSQSPLQPPALAANDAMEAEAKEDNPNNGNNTNTNVRPSTGPTVVIRSQHQTRKEQVLDAFTIALFIAIVAILAKKFFVRVMNQM